MTELDRALAAFGAKDRMIWVLEHSPETSPGEVKVQVFDARNGAFLKNKTQADGDVLAALAFIRDRWMPEVRW